MLPNFAVLPPEVNSARVFAGAGSAPMLAAAAAWDDLASERCIVLQCHSGRLRRDWWLGGGRDRRRRRWWTQPRRTSGG